MEEISPMAGRLEIRAFFEEPTNTVSYPIWDRDSREAAGDAGLAAPLRLLPSIQVNIRAGRFPEAESDGVRYLKIPVRGKMAA